MPTDLDPDSLSLTGEEEAALAALADGTLPDERRRALGRRLPRASDLDDLAAEQRRAIEAVRALEVRSPSLLRARIALLRAGRKPPRRRRRYARPRRRLRPATNRGRSRVGSSPARRRRVLALSGLGAVVAGIVAALALPGAVAPGLTIVEAADRTLAGPTAPPPPRGVRYPNLLIGAAGGVRFPFLEESFGWRAIGTRSDLRGDHRLMTVTYEQGRQRLGYTIVVGARLPPPAATTDQVERAVRLRFFLAGGRPVLTFVRDGRTCILSGAGLSMEELVTLGGWRGDGQVRF